MKTIIAAVLACAVLSGLAFAACVPRRAEEGGGTAWETAPDTATEAGENTLSGPGAEEDEHPSAQTFREATLYYISDEGFVVPVKKAVPKQEGIASACLACLTDSAENEAYAAALGMNTVLPEGTGMRLAISNGEAKLDLVGLAPFADAEAELKALTALVNTLCEFSTVDRVTITRDGSSEPLEHGTSLPKASPALPLNVEQTELAASSGAQPRTLYFPNSGGAYAVPVTRYFSAEPSLYATVAALIAGPEAEGLLCCFPEGTLLLGAALENGAATVNLSSDFEAVSETPGMFTLARETLLRTLSAVYPVDSVSIEVNGREFVGDGR